MQTEDLSNFDPRATSPSPLRTAALLALLATDTPTVGMIDAQNNEEFEVPPQARIVTKIVEVKNGVFIETTAEIENETAIMFASKVRGAEQLTDGHVAYHFFDGDVVKRYGYFVTNEGQCIDLNGELSGLFKRFQVSQIGDQVQISAVSIQDMAFEAKIDENGKVDWDALNELGGINDMLTLPGETENAVIVAYNNGLSINDERLEFFTGKTVSRLIADPTNWKACYVVADEKLYHLTDVENGCKIQEVADINPAIAQILPGLDKLVGIRRNGNGTFVNRVFPFVEKPAEA